MNNKVEKDRSQNGYTVESNLHMFSLHSIMANANQISCRAVIISERSEAIDCVLFENLLGI